MKTFRKTAGGALMAIFMLSLTACSDDDDNNDATETLAFNQFEIEYNSEGYWSKCYDTAQGDLSLGDFTFTHTASADEYYGVVYESWTGFCPTRVNDGANYGKLNEETGVWDTSDWVNHQWASVTGGGVAGKGTPYMLGDWAISSANETPCVITYKGGKLFNPQSIYVTNNTYAFYCMKYGSAFSKAFGADDWCKLIINGYNQGGIVGSVEVYMAKGTDILNEWKQVDLSGMGMVDALIFTMASSDTGQWGMNNPAYFCIDGLRYKTVK